jgi:hypothetical protein
MQKLIIAKPVGPGEGHFADAGSQAVPDLFETTQGEVR